MPGNIPHLPSPFHTDSRGPGWKLQGQMLEHLEEIILPLSQGAPCSWPSPGLRQTRTDPKEPRPPSLKDVSMSHSQAAGRKGASLMGSLCP